MAEHFQGRHVVVTGGTGALGTAVVRRVIESGGHCHVPCVSAEELRHFPFAHHARVRVMMGGELRDEATVVRLFEETPELWASVHCAGGFAMSPIGETSASAFLDMVEMNALSCFLCCREAVRRMRAFAGSRQGRASLGRIVNVAARPAVEPRSGAGMVAYAAAKSAVASLTAALAEEVAGEGILVNAVVPSIMDTPANRRAMPSADHSKWATVDEVAATIAFLASPANASTRGGLVPVSGCS